MFAVEVRLGALVGRFTLGREPDNEVEAEVVFGCHTEVADDEYEPVFGFAGGAQCHTE